MCSMCTTFRSLEADAEVGVLVPLPEERLGGDGIGGEVDLRVERVAGVILDADGDRGRRSIVAAVVATVRIERDDAAAGDCERKNSQTREAEVALGRGHSLLLTVVWPF